VSPVKYEQGFYIPEDDILHSDRHGNFKSYMETANLTKCLYELTVMFVSGC
jgi:hypothetical protein